MPDSVSSATSAAASAATSTTKNALGQLDSNAFLKLLTAQLRYQNPFSPSDPSAMLGQVATYAQVEALQKIQAAQASSTALEQARMAGEIMGKRVTGTDANGIALTGIVSAARFTPSGPMLTLDNGKEMALSNVEVISTTTPAATTTSTGGTTGSTSSGTTGSGSTSSDTTGTTGTTGRPASSGSSSSGGSSTGSSSTGSDSAASSSTNAATRSVVAAVASYADAVAAARRTPSLAVA